MKDVLLIFIAVFAFSATQLTTRLFQIKLQKSKHSINLFQALYTFIAALAYFYIAFAQNSTFSPNIILPALLFGICFAFASLNLAKCMDMGYMSLSVVIVNLSLILPVIFSWTVMNEDIKTNAVIGLLFIIITLVLSSKNTDDEENGDIKKWLLLVSLAFLANGGSAIVQKQYKVIWGEKDLMLFMALAYLVSSLIFTVTYVINNSKSNLPPNEQIKKPALFLLLVIISGLCSFGGNALLGYLCDKVNGGLLYPCVNGGISVVASIASFLLFKEEINNRKIVAICTGIIAIILLNL